MIHHRTRTKQLFLLPPFMLCGLQGLVSAVTWILHVPPTDTVEHVGINVTKQLAIRAWNPGKKKAS
jgi:hypothetical protein